MALERGRYSCTANPAHETTVPPGYRDLSNTPCPVHKCTGRLVSTKRKQASR